MIRKIIDFFTFGIWHIGEKELSTRSWWAVKQLRVIIFTARGLGKHDVEMRSAALSFFTVVSLVPVMALLFVIFRGFGMETTFSSWLHDLLPQYKDVVDHIVQFINNLLLRTRSGIMAVSAFGVLLWAVIQVFGNVESAFNRIWEVKNNRSFARRFSVYMALVIMVPMLLLAANSVYLGIRRRVEVFTGNIGAEIVFSTVAAAIVIFMFSVVYYVLPDTDVKYKNALKAGVVAGIAFSLFQVVYVFIQGNLSSYNAIYGTFAAIPLFLLWLQISWQILLFGGELSFAMQNIRDFESERVEKKVSYDNRLKVMVAVMAIVVRNYLDGGTLSTPDRVAEELGVPVRMIRDVSRELETDGLLLFARNEKTGIVDSMAPARDPHSMRFFDVMDGVTGHGDDIPDLREGTELLRRIHATFENVRRDMRDEKDNVLLTSLCGLRS